MLQDPVDILAETGSRALYIDLHSFLKLGASRRKKVSLWLKQLPFPIVGVVVGADTVEDQLRECFDVVVEENELSLLHRNISTNPEAATVLVQVLRAVEDASPQDGLLIESLAYATLQSGTEYSKWLTTNNAPEANAVREDSPAVLLSRSENILSVVLNRAKNDNAYSAELRNGLWEAFNLARMDSSVERVEVSAKGRCFSTGGELSEFGDISSPLEGHLIRCQALPAKLVLSDPKRFHFHVHKACIGSGLELPACGGYVSASPKTLFWLPELAMGLIPGAGGCVSICKRIGRQRTAYMVLMNKKIDAKKALHWGLIDSIQSH